ncbi:hypothetical protein D050_3038B, partial [Vibrio parahaemolyticus VPCR-2009]
RNKLIYNGISL